MEYKTELHCHSRDGSGCASETAEGIVKKYLEHGYSTVCMTNHLLLMHDDTDREEWEKIATEKWNAYEKLREAAEKDGRGLNVLLGMEFRLRDTWNDYLLFGLDRDYLFNFDPSDMKDIRTFSNRVREDGMFLVQAHPFRYYMTVVNPDFMDGIEAYNGHSGHESHNEIAEMFAKYHGKIMTSGTDHHDPCHLPTGGIITDTEIKNNDDLLRILRSGDFRLIKTKLR